MAAINGTNVLLYSNGTVIALQKGLSISVDADLPDATNKQSGGWAQHIHGMRNAKIDFNSLFSASASPAMSAADLMNLIISRESIVVEILGLSYPIIGEADMSSLSFDAPAEGVMGLTGSMKINGQLFLLSAAIPNLITDPADSTDYDTNTTSGTAFTSLVNVAGTAYSLSNAISVTDEYVYKLFVYVVLNSGELPSVGIWDNTSAYISNEVQLSEGPNVVTLTATATDGTSSLRISNTDATDLETSSIYLVEA